jgi:hypothetical protein
MIQHKVKILGLNGSKEKHKNLNISYTNGE